MPPVIVAEQLTKWYGPRLAVDHVSLEVEAGEVLGLLGPNGSERRPSSGSSPGIFGRPRELHASPASTS